jgi:hypothetical protein
MATDIHHGEKPVGEYQFITSNMLDIFKLHGNLVVSIRRLDKALRKIAKVKFGTTFGNIFVKAETSRDPKMITKVGECMNELLNELKELSGYSNITYRKLPPQTELEQTCLILEGRK